MKRTLFPTITTFSSFSSLPFPSLSLTFFRSCGYQWRPSIPIKEIERLTKFLKEEYQLKTNRDLIIFCDNCYGEFVEDKEPTHVGVDLIAGSLIKNLGGTRVPCGGYIAGRKDLVAAASNHLSAPGVEGGATLGQYKSLFQVRSKFSLPNFP